MGYTGFKEREMKLRILTIILVAVLIPQAGAWDEPRAMQQRRLIGVFII